MIDHDIITADEVAALLRRKSKRCLDRRHEWQPKFPAPFARWPLTWLRRDVLAWIEARRDLQQRRAA